MRTRNCRDAQALVEADEVGVAFVGLQAASDGFSLLFVVALGADADPVAGGAFEVDDVRGLVSAFELVAQLLGLVLMLKSSDLHAPAAAEVDRMRSLVDLDAHVGEAGAINACGFGGSHGEIEQPAL